MTARGHRAELAARAVGLKILGLLGIWVAVSGAIYALTNLTEGFFDAPLISRMIIVLTILMYGLGYLWLTWEERQINLRARLEIVVIVTALFMLVLVLRWYTGADALDVIRRMSYQTGIVAVMLYVSTLRWNVEVWSKAGLVILFLVALNWSWAFYDWWVKFVPEGAVGEIVGILAAQQWITGSAAVVVATLQLIVALRQRVTSGGRE